MVFLPLSPTKSLNASSTLLEMSAQVVDNANDVDIIGKLLCTINRDLLRTDRGREREQLK